MPYSAKPPGLMSRLKMLTSCPACAIFCAANIPAGPAPITNTVFTWSSACLTPWIGLLQRTQRNKQPAGGLNPLSLRQPAFLSGSTAVPYYRLTLGGMSAATLVAAFDVLRRLRVDLCAYQLQLGVAADGFQKLAGHTIVNISGVLELDRIADHHFHARGRDAQAALRSERAGADRVEGPLHAPALDLHSVVILGEDFVHGVEHALFYLQVIAPWPQGKSNLMPDKIRSRDLFKHSGIGLKHYSVREGNNPACGPCAIAGNLHHVQAHQADVDHVSDDPGNLNAVAHADPVLSDQEEIAGDGKDHVLQSDGDAGGEKTGKRRDGAQFAGEGN